MPPAVLAIGAVAGVLGGIGAAVAATTTLGVIAGVATAAASVASGVASIVSGPQSQAASISRAVASGIPIFANILSEKPLFKFPGRAPGEVPTVPTEIGDLTAFSQLLGTIADFVAKHGKVLDESVGLRLEKLSGTAGGLLESVLKDIFPQLGKGSTALAGLFTTVAQAIFPEISKARIGLDHLIFNQFPTGFTGIAQNVRYQGVSERTLAILKRRGLVPRNITTNPDGFDFNGGGDLDVATAPLEDLPQGEVPGELPLPPEAVLGFPAITAEVGAAELLSVVTGEGLRSVKDAVQSFAGTLLADLFAVVAPLGKGIITEAGNAMLGFRDLASGTFGTVGITILEGIGEDLARGGTVAPGEQKEIVRRALGNAFSLGVGAHLTASLAEMLMPLKHLGLPQIAALMVDLAGFGA
ncbi:MAG: hypothetical protein ACREJ6_02120, partial [Candidatus Methylomirabilis sp.]